MYLLGHTSEETAFTVDNYPWGYTLKTQRRYWVETKDKKGQRFCYQTKNPKTGKWCAIKKGTYKACVILLQDENGHVGTTSFHPAESSEKIEVWAGKNGKVLTDWQKDQCRLLGAFHRATEKYFKENPIKFTSSPAIRIV